MKLKPEWRITLEHVPTANLIFGCGAETDDDCAEMLKRLEGKDADFGFTTEVSHRNRIPLNILKVEAPNVELRGRAL